MSLVDPAGDLPGPFDDLVFGLGVRQSGRCVTAGPVQQGRELSTRVQQWLGHVQRIRCHRGSFLSSVQASTPETVDRGAS